MKLGNLLGNRWLFGASLLLMGCEGKSATAATAAAATPSAQTAAVAVQPSASRGPVLVVLSSSNRLPLKNGRSQATGYFLNEVMVPVRALLKAHYEPVFATPNGTPAVADPHSESASFFADEADYRDVLALRQRLDGLRQTRTLKSVLEAGLEPYRAVLVPGGHAAMGDLTESGELGVVLRHFHDRRKPTALICHGPGALLSTLPPAFEAALVKGDNAAAKAESSSFPYAGYRLTVFSSAEEQAVEEGGTNGFLAGKVRFYLDQALATAGAKVDVQAPFKSHVVVDRELITAQQPASDGAFTQALLAALEKSNPSGAIPRD